MKYLWRIESQNEKTGESVTDVFIVEDENDINNFKGEKQQLALKKTICDSSTKWKRIEIFKEVRPVRIYNLFSKKEDMNKQDYHRLIWSFLLHNVSHSVSMGDVDKILQGYEQYGENCEHKNIVKALKRPLGSIKGEITNILYLKNGVLYLGEGENIISTNSNIDEKFFKLNHNGFRNYSVSNALWFSNVPDDELIEIINSKKPVCYYYGVSDERKVYTLNKLNEKEENTALIYLTKEGIFDEVEMISTFFCQIVTLHNKQKKYIFDIFMLLAEKYGIIIDSKDDIKQAISTSSWDSLTKLFEELLYYSDENYYIVIGDVPNNMSPVLSWVDSISHFSNICQIIVSLNTPPNDISDDIFVKKYTSTTTEDAAVTPTKQNENKIDTRNVNTSINIEEQIKQIAQDNNVYKTIMMATFLKDKSFKLTADLVFDELNRFTAKELSEKSDHIIDCSSDNHIIFTGDETVFSFLKGLIKDDNSIIDHFSQFCLRVIRNGNYRGMDVSDLLLIRDYYLSNIDRDLQEELSHKFIRFEIYTILSLWDGNDSYLKYFETNHHISYWVNNTEILFNHISSEYLKLDSNSREELRIQFLKAKQRMAYSKFYSGEVESAISYLEEIRDNNPDLYGSHYQFTFSISDSLAWWNRISHPEKSLKICDNFIEYANSLGFSLEDYALGVMSHYKCIMLYLLGVKNNDTKFFSEASEYALQLLYQLAKTTDFNEKSNNKLYGKIRILLVQSLCREKRYDEAIIYCEKEISVREKHKDSFYYYNALLTLCKILTYKYRDTDDEESFEKASKRLNDLLNQIKGIKLSGVKLVYADLIEYKVEKTGDVLLLKQAYDYIMSALRIANEWNGDKGIDYITAQNHLNSFIKKYPDFQNLM